VNSLNILIVDDSAVLRRSLRNSLQQQPEWIICGEAENGRQGIDKALQLHPNVIVIDLIMPVMNGIEAARVLKRLLPSTPLVMFTTFTDAFLCKEALAAGVDALIPKSDGAEPLIQSIKALASSVPPASAA
jgi:DNA-binding NarL/FixJ family response regulator